MDHPAAWAETPSPPACCLEWEGLLTNCCELIPSMICLRSWPRAERRSRLFSGFVCTAKQPDSFRAATNMWRIWPLVRAQQIVCFPPCLRPSVVGVLFGCGSPHCTPNNQIRSKPRWICQERALAEHLRNAGKNLYAFKELSSRPQPQAPAARETEAKWRDPKDVAVTMQFQGILPGNRPGDAPLQSLEWKLLPPSKKMHEENWENASYLHGRGHTVGISPLASGAALLRRRSRWQLSAVSKLTKPPVLAAASPHCVNLRLIASKGRPKNKAERLSNARVAPAPSPVAFLQQFFQDPGIALRPASWSRDTWTYLTRPDLEYPKERPP